MQSHPLLQPLRGCSLLVLDTTYCSPEHVFPTQAAVLKYTLAAVKAELFNPRCVPRALILSRQLLRSIATTPETPKPQF